MIYHDRTDAGRALASRLANYAGRNDVVVLALPRGGVPVAYEVARVLNAPLDVFIVRKIGVPGQEELAMGAAASGGMRVLNDDVVRGLGIPSQVIDRMTEVAMHEIERRERLYRDGAPLIDVRGRVVILVDDGLATGATMRAAVTALRTQNPARIVIAVPVAASATCDAFRGEVEEIVCAQEPPMFFAVGQWYRNFEQTTDEEVHDLLQRARQPHAA